MKRRLFAAALSCVIILSAGCTKSNILNPEGKPQPDFSAAENVVLDWNQVSDDLTSYYEYDEYPEIVTFNYAHRDEEKMIVAQLFVEDTIDGETAARYGADLIRHINDSIAIQDNSLALSDENSFGGFFDEYGFTIQVIPNETHEDESTWLVNMTVPAGEHTPITPVLNE